MSVLRKDLRAITADGAASSMVIGVGETYLPAFVLAISGNELACGLISTVPVVLGSLLALIGPYSLRQWQSYRGWVVSLAVVQVAVYVSLVAAGLRGAMPLLLLYLLIALYWGAGQAGGASWAAWTGTLVPDRCRTRYFAWRTRICQAATLCGFVVGGLLLGSQPGSAQFVAFALLFGISAASRLVSAWSLSRQSEPIAPGNEPRLPGLGELRAIVSRSGMGRIFCYVLAIQMAMQIVAPFFPPYMLSKLRFSYPQFMLLMCALYLGKVVCAPALGRLANRFGTQSLLWVGGIATIPCAALWLVSDSFVYLLVLQFYAGAAWGAYELAVLLLAFEVVPRPKRVGLLTVFNLANAVALVGGSLLGGAILYVMAETREAYLVLLVVSTVARIAALAFLVRMPATITKGAVSTIRAAPPPKPALIGQPALASHLAARLVGPHWDRKLPPLEHELQAEAATFRELSQLN